MSNPPTTFEMSHSQYLKNRLTNPHNVWGLETVLYTYNVVKHKHEGKS